MLSCCATITTLQQRNVHLQSMLADFVLVDFRLSFVGDGMTACGLGLAMGLGLLAATEFLGEETLHDMLTFNPGNFFT